MRRKSPACKAWEVKGFDSESILAKTPAYDKMEHAVLGTVFRVRLLSAGCSRADQSWTRNDRKRELASEPGVNAKRACGSEASALVQAGRAGGSELSGHASDQTSSDSTSSESYSSSSGDKKKNNNNKKKSKKRAKHNKKDKANNAKKAQEENMKTKHEAQNHKQLKKTESHLAKIKAKLGHQHLQRSGVMARPEFRHLPELIKQPAQTAQARLDSLQTRSEEASKDLSLDMPETKESASCAAR